MLLEGNTIKRECYGMYKGSLDALLYLALYIIIPASQVIEYIISNNSERFWCIILLLASILYDCYSRFHPDMLRTERIVLWVIGMIAVFEGIVSIVLHYVIRSNLQLPIWVYYLYTPMIFPLIVCLWRLLQLSKQEFEI